jgi:hypothetical protein
VVEDLCGNRWDLIEPKGLKRALPQDRTRPSVH